MKRKIFFSTVVLFLVFSVVSLGASVAVVDSRATAAYYGEESYNSSNENTFSSLNAAGIEYSVITDAEITNGIPEDVKVLILQSNAVVSDEEVKIINEYVAKGGKILAAYEEGCKSADLSSRENFAFGDLFKIDTPAWDAKKFYYIKLGEEGEKVFGTDMGEYVYMSRGFTFIANRYGGISLGEWCKDNEGTPSTEPNLNTAIVMSEAGIYFGENIFLLARTNRTASLFISRAVQYLLGQSITTSNEDFKTKEAMDKYEKSINETTKKLEEIKTRINKLSPVFRNDIEELKSSLADLENKVKESSFEKTDLSDLEAGINNLKVICGEAHDLWLETFSTESVEMRAVWMSNSQLGQLRNREDVAKLLDKVALAGFNMVMPEVIFRGNTMYSGPFQDSRFADWSEDAMKVFVEEAQKRDLQIHAWVWGPCVGFGGAGNMLLAHPEWVNLRENGMDKTDKNALQWFDPAIPEARHFMVDNYMELLDRYDIDGLHIDYMRYNDRPGGDFGYTEYSLSQFKADTGIDARTVKAQSEEEARWIEWRESKVTAIVEELANRISESHPEIIISGAVGSDPTSARRLRMQNWKYWAEKGWLKLAFQMIYTKDIDALRSNLDLLKELNRDTVTIYPGLGALVVSEDEILEQVEVVREAGYNGMAIFSTDHFRDDHYYNFSKSVYSEPATIPSDNPEKAATVILNKMKTVAEGTNLTEVLATIETVSVDDIEKLIAVTAELDTENSTTETILTDIYRIESMLKTAEYRKTVHLEATPGSIEFLVEKDDGSYDWLSSKNKNLAMVAEIKVESSFDGYCEKPLNDGQRNNMSEIGRWSEIAWASNEVAGEHWIELYWDKPQTIQTVSIFWAPDCGKFYSSTNYEIQTFVNGKWEKIYDYSSETGSYSIKMSSITFIPVTTQKLRIYQPENGGPAKRGNIMWVSEIEVY